ncbi:hypothetical protein ACFY5F_29540 [Streptomyces sp. NPDC013161]
MLGLQPAGTEQVPAGVERQGSDEDRGGEGKDQYAADRPQLQTAPLLTAP